MPLDENLFTLKIRRSEEEPGALDLVDPKGQLYYRKRFIPPQKVGDAPTTPLYDLWGERLHAFCCGSSGADLQATFFSL